jgi:hypothetical protein
MLLFVEMFIRHTWEGSWSFRKSGGSIIGTKGEWHSQPESMWLIEGLSVGADRTRQQLAKTQPPSRFAIPFDN